MLRVSCWTGTDAGAQLRAPLGQPDADHDAVAELAMSVSAGRGVGQRLVGRLRLLERLEVDGGERDPDAIGRLGLLERR